MPISPVVQGLLGAYQVADMVARSKRADEDQRLRQRQFDDEQMERDLRVRFQMNEAGRPLLGGMVDDQAEVPFLGGGTIAVPYQRKADPKRTVKYKTREGEALEYELLTPEEQAGRRLRARATERADDFENELRLTREKAAIEARKRAELFQQELTEIDRRAKLLSDLEKQKAGSRETLEEKKIGARSELEEKKIGARSELEEKKIAARRPTGAAALKAASAAAREAKADRVKNLTVLQTEHDKLDKEEQGFHAQRVRFGEELKKISAQLEDADDTQARQLNTRRIQLEGEMLRLKKLAEERQRMKREKLREKDKLSTEETSTVKETKTVAATTKAREIEAVNPQTGERLVLRNGQWVRK